MLCINCQEANKQTHSFKGILPKIKYLSGVLRYRAHAFFRARVLHLKSGWDTVVFKSSSEAYTTFLFETI